MVRRLFGRRGPETVKDHVGRPVELTDERWNHIVEGHPELDGLRPAVKRAVERADKKVMSKRPGVELLCGRNLGPAKWLVVVVAFERGQGRILTAYPQTKDPEELR